MRHALRTLAHPLNDAMRRFASGQANGMRFALHYALYAIYYIEWGTRAQGHLYIQRLENGTASHMPLSRRRTSLRPGRQ